MIFYIPEEEYILQPLETRDQASLCLIQFLKVIEFISGIENRTDIRLEISLMLKIILYLLHQEKVFVEQIIDGKKRQAVTKDLTS